MREISTAQLEQILEGNSENLNLEFKASFNFEENIWARERMIRSILAMSNTRDGGYIIIGVKENEDKTYEFTGLETKHFSLLQSKIEDLKSKVESFSSSPVNYEIGTGEYKGKRLILINVIEFSVNPLICRKNGEDKGKNLEAGAIYVRTLKDKPSSVKLINSVDIQDFLERSADKQIVNFHKRGWRHESENVRNKESAFESERVDFFK